MIREEMNNRLKTCTFVLSDFPHFAVAIKDVPEGFIVVTKYSDLDLSRLHYFLFPRTLVRNFSIQNTQNSPLKQKAGYFPARNVLAISFDWHYIYSSH